MHFKLDDVAATVAGNVDNSVLIRHWTARIMAFSSAWRTGWCRTNKRFDDDGILDVLGFLPSREGRLRRPPQALGTIISQDRIEDLLSSDDLYRNVEKLGERLSLTEAERRLLVFVCYKSASEILNTACCLVKDLSWRKFVSVLAKVVDVPEHEAQAALRPGSVLRV